MSTASRSIVSAISILSASLLLAATASGDPVQIPRDVPFYDVTIINSKLLECSLGTRLGSSLQQFTEKYGVQTQVVDEIDPNAPGRVFQVQITSAMSRGNAFVGHSKSVSAKGELFVDGESQGYVNFTRDSGGGFGAGFKGSCAVLGRCTKTLGNDFAKWLKERN